MKIALGARTDIKTIPPEASEIHLVRPVKQKKIGVLLKKHPALKIFSLSKSCLQRLPEKTKKLLKEKGIELKIESKRGRAIEIGLEKMLHVIEMRRDFQPLREIEDITGIPKSTIHYLEKYAQRVKVKKGNSIVYLK